MRPSCGRGTLPRSASRRLPALADHPPAPLTPKVRPMPYTARPTDRNPNDRIRGKRKNKHTERILDHNLRDSRGLHTGIVTERASTLCEMSDVVDRNSLTTKLLLRSWGPQVEETIEMPVTHHQLVRGHIVHTRVIPVTKVLTRSDRTLLTQGNVFPTVDNLKVKRETGVSRLGIPSKTKQRLIKTEKETSEVLKTVVTPEGQPKIKGFKL